MLYYSQYCSIAVRDINWIYTVLNFYSYSFLTTPTYMYINIECIRENVNQYNNHNFCLNGKKIQSHGPIYIFCNIFVLSLE